MTSHNYLVRKRVERAKDMLARTDYSLTEIALAAGFSDQSHLARNFPLRPPATEGLADLTRVAARLCKAMTASSEFRYRGTTLELPILIDAEQCWRVCLIIAELINNSCRHAIFSSSGRITVVIESSPQRVICAVSDTGSTNGAVAAGLGTRLTDALAAEVHGSIKRQFDRLGGTVTLSVPREHRHVVDPVAPEEIDPVYEGYLFEKAQEGALGD